MNLSHSSGNDALDNAAREAVQGASPFPAFPTQWREKSLTFRFHFFYDHEPSLEAPACNGPGRGGAFRLESGMTGPRATYQPDPEYSEDARKAKYQGVVVLSGTVESDGDFDNLCVEQPLGYGLDEKAVTAVKAWKFEPASKDGQAVPVRISVEVAFRIY
jgi:TonB family protein